MLLSKKTAIITGAAAGMGKAIAIKFASEGCNIAAVDINLQGASETAEEVKKQGRESVAIKADITKSAQIKDMTEKVVEKFGQIDILINSAGTLFDIADHSKKGIDLIPEDQWDKLVDINLKGCFICCKYVVPYMKERRYGKIVNFSSLGAIHPPAVCPHYNAAKAGVLGLTLDMAAELASYNITVNAILPGGIMTAFYDPLKEAMGEQGKGLYDFMSKDVPLGRLGTPEDITGPALFLASEMSSYVTGVQLLVAGGQPLGPRG